MVHCTLVAEIHIYSHGCIHIHVYMQVHPSVRLGPLVTREIDVLASSESPAGGEASEAAPWHYPGQGGVCICAALARD